MNRPLREYADRRDVEWANLYADGRLGTRDSDVHWIEYIRADGCVALVRIKKKVALPQDKEDMV